MSSKSHHKGNKGNITSSGHGTGNILSSGHGTGNVLSSGHGTHNKHSGGGGHGYGGMMGGHDKSKNSSRSGQGYGGHGGSDWDRDRDGITSSGHGTHNRGDDKNILSSGHGTHNAYGMGDSSYDDDHEDWSKQSRSSKSEKSYGGGDSGSFLEEIGGMLGLGESKGGGKYDDDRQESDDDRGDADWSLKKVVSSVIEKLVESKSGDSGWGKGSDDDKKSKGGGFLQSWGW